jgi:Uncharacterized protein conserved in bacteria (DUF2330)
MAARIWLALVLSGIFVLPWLLVPSAPACCSVGPSGKPVVNADQTVIILWDANTGTEHFIRQASFKSEAEDFGFLVPSPAEPELSESGNDAFPFLLKVTEPEIQYRQQSSGVSCGIGCAKSKASPQAVAGKVDVIQEKLVAGFHARVLEATSADALVDWLKDNGYNYSPEVAAWAKPYVDAKWKITALKVVKDQTDKDKKTVPAGSLRMSFKTDRPLFPYREPDSKSAAEALNAKNRLLRIYFIGEARYQGELTKDTPWTGKVAWSDKLKSEQRSKLLELLKLPAATFPAELWLTEFEDNWPYKLAPADVYFSRDADQSTVKREAIIRIVFSPWPTDVMACALAAFVILPPVVRRLRRHQAQ